MQKFKKQSNIGTQSIIKQNDNIQITSNVLNTFSSKNFNSDNSNIELYSDNILTINGKLHLEDKLTIGNTDNQINFKNVEKFNLRLNGELYRQITIEGELINRILNIFRNNSILYVDNVGFDKFNNCYLIDSDNIQQSDLDEIYQVTDDGSYYPQFQINQDDTIYDNHYQLQFEDYRDVNLIPSNILKQKFSDNWDYINDYIIDEIENDENETYMQILQTNKNKLIKLGLINNQIQSTINSGTPINLSFNLLSNIIQKIKVTFNILNNGNIIQSKTKQYYITNPRKEIISQYVYTPETLSNLNFEIIIEQEYPNSLIMIEKPQLELRTFNTTFTYNQRKRPNLLYQYYFDNHSGIYIHFWSKQRYTHEQLQKHIVNITDILDLNNLNMSWSLYPYIETNILRYNFFIDGSVIHNDIIPLNDYNIKLTNWNNYQILLYDNVFKIYINGILIKEYNDINLDYTKLQYIQFGQRTDLSDTNMMNGLLEDIFIGKQKDNNGNLLYTEEIIQQIYNKPYPFDRFLYL